MIKGVHELHILGFAHRNIQPKSILLSSSGNIKLTCFENLGKLEHGRDFHYVVLPANFEINDFMAPELVKVNFQSIIFTHKR